jgi:hypothetical protein
MLKCFYEFRMRRHTIADWPACSLRYLVIVILKIGGTIHQNVFWSLPTQSIIFCCIGLWNVPVKWLIEVELILVYFFSTANQPFFSSLVHWFQQLNDFRTSSPSVGYGGQIFIHCFNHFIPFTGSCGILADVRQIHCFPVFSTSSKCFSERTPLPGIIMILSSAFSIELAISSVVRGCWSLPVSPFATDCYNIFKTPWIILFRSKPGEK